jgi:acyl carrier protein
MIRGIIRRALETQGVEVTSDDQKILGEIDSISLVSLIMDIEDDFREQGLPIKLVSDKAFSWTHSPFATINTLINYIEELTSCEKPT